MENKTIISLIMSGLFGIYKIFSASKNRSYAEIRLIERNWIPLITTNFNELSQTNIEHKLPFDSNQYYYRGTIINSGTIDIYKTLILKPVKIEFEEEIKVMSFKFSEMHNEIELNYKLQENKVEINWDILKPLEKFSFELIIESKNNLKIYEFNQMLKINCRIAGIEKIEKTSSWSLKNYKKQFLTESIPTYFFLLIMYGIFSFLIYSGIKSYYNPTPIISYNVVSKSLNEKIENIKYYDSTKVKIEGFSKKKLIANSELKNDLQVKILIKKYEKRYWLVIIGVLALLLISIRTVRLIREDIHDFKLKRVYKALE